MAEDEAGAHAATEPEGHSRREILRLGAVAGAVAAGAVLLGGAASAQAAPAARLVKSYQFRVALDSVDARRVRRVEFVRQRYAVLETPAGETSTYEPLASGDLDLLVVLSAAETSLPAWFAWFEAVRAGTDSGDPRTLRVEMLASNLVTVTDTWDLLVRPKRYERVLPAGAAATLEHHFLLRGSMGPSRL